MGCQNYCQKQVYHPIRRLEKKTGKTNRQTDRQTDRQTNRQKLTCRSSANFVSAGQKYADEFPISYRIRFMTYKTFFVLGWYQGFKGTLSYMSISVCLSVCLCVFPVFFSRRLIGSYTGFWQWFWQPTYPTRCSELGWAVPHSDFLAWLSRATLRFFSLAEPCHTQIF